MERIPSLTGKLELGKERRPEFGPIWLDLNSRKLSSAGTSDFEILPPAEYQTLWLLIRAAGCMVTEQEIVNFIYDDDEKDLPTGNQIGVYVSHLRAKLDKLTNGVVTIENVRGLSSYRISLDG